MQAQIDTYLDHLNGLIHRGRQLHEALASNPSSKPALASTRIWQQDCAITINQLSGGSKAHWLSRAFSQAFLVRSDAGAVIEAVPAGEIVSRLMGVLEQAVASLSEMRDGNFPASSGIAPSPGYFEFVHNPELRPVVEQAYSESRQAFEERRFDRALLTTCAILDAIVTDALEHQRLTGPDAAGRPEGEIADWPFEKRLSVAESSGLIGRGCVRLPPIARRYRDLALSDGGQVPEIAVSEREARLAGQVLHVVMRDLNPGR